MLCHGDFTLRHPYVFGGKNLGFSAVLANIKNLSAPPGGKTSGA